VTITITVTMMMMMMMMMMIKDFVLLGEVLALKKPSILIEIEEPYMNIQNSSL
jgi:hypothetical protein